jgi:hypothetical protein
MSPRAGTEADCWQWYRLKSLKFRLLGLSTTSYCGFVEGKPDTLPASGAQIMELLDSVAHMGPQETVWSRWVNVPKKALAGPLPWYKTVLGGATDEEEVNGFLVLAGTGTATVNVEYYFTFEFKGPIATANTPLMAELTRKLREEKTRLHAEKRRGELLAQLSAPGLTGPSSALQTPK